MEFLTSLVSFELSERKKKPCGEASSVVIEVNLGFTLCSNLGWTEYPRNIIMFKWPFIRVLEKATAALLGNEHLWT